MAQLIHLHPPPLIYHFVVFTAIHQITYRACQYQIAMISKEELDVNALPSSIVLYTVAVTRLQLRFPNMTSFTTFKA